MRLGWLVLLAGCNQLYALDTTKLEGDLDGDGIPDVRDNCPQDWNAEQLDEDRDDIGDLCDNCVIVSNHDQTDVGDRDGVGDVCDPHPANSGDCLVLFDTFATLDPSWTATNTTPVHGDGAVTIVAPSMMRAALLVDLVGQYDVQLAVTVPPALQARRISAIAAGDMATHGARCTLLTLAASTSLQIEATSENVSTSQFMSSAAFGDQAILRLTSEAPDETAEVGCRIDYGVAVGTVSIGGAAPAFTGVGVVVDSTEVQIDSIAVYRFVPKGTCPEAVRR